MSKRKEHFSYAYVSAVCASAGFDCVRTGSDDDSIDLLILARRLHVRRAPRVDIQVKCRTGIELRETDFSIQIPRKNFDDLSDPHVSTPRILVVVRVPSECEEWMVQNNEERAIMKHCGYWRALYDAPLPIEDQATVTVRLPRDKVFSVAGLTQIMRTIAAGGAL
ncbi:DUF4365 domain-containing protein [Stigmatella sp. ncwal1]|uniref:DUF4365 domain-containing protein n=1 Tax=Stigmatella ashevillensis TaxID=2995309 RepID=A0ABT5DHM9_9BACT|nr:DUF4365 domain-containing protein [Stigmatella ashevillena]MDC0713123.1 DUF4365 domain-containing protein [Stigmatella ashevillena]